MYCDSNIIALGDHCAISMILKEVELRQESYPFDWVVKKDQFTNYADSGT